LNSCGPRSRSVSGKSKTARGGGRRRPESQQ
jgi:hypothetical protein